MNVIGSVPDGWWTDRAAALRRLVEALVDYDFEGEWIVVVADGQPVEDLPAGTRGDVELRYAGRSDPDAADDDIVALLSGLFDDSALDRDVDVGDVDSGSVESGGVDGGECDPVTVVTSDGALRGRVVALGARVEGARAFRRRVGW